MTILGARMRLVREMDERSNAMSYFRL